MPRIIEVPTHLNVEDALLLGLTAGQLARGAACASLAYGAWDQAAGLPVAVRAALSICLVLLGLALALIRPGGRPLDEWAFAAAAFALMPRRLCWRSVEPDRPTRQSADPTDWAEMTPTVGWRASTSSPVDFEDEDDRMPSTRRWWFGLARG
jgi:hypothetical protein